MRITRRKINIRLLRRNILLRINGENSQTKNLKGAATVLQSFQRFLLLSPHLKPVTLFQNNITQVKCPKTTVLHCITKRFFSFLFSVPEISHLEMKAASLLALQSYISICILFLWLRNMCISFFVNIWKYFCSSFQQSEGKIFLLVYHLNGNMALFTTEQFMAK